jgi:hypothetical protein
MLLTHAFSMLVLSSPPSPLVWQDAGIDAQGLWKNEQARLRIYERNMTAAIERYPCAPPSQQEIEETKSTLNDFLVIRANGAGLTLEVPQEQELADLAYFRAASSGSLGDHEQADKSGSWLNRGLPNRKRDALWAKLSDAKLRGNMLDVEAAARAYLQTLGYPGQIRGGEEGAYAWGGARYSSVMRDLANVDEALGNNAEAARLYRLANPGGGACGASVDGLRRDHLKGVIRTEENAGRCRGAVVSRLQLLSGDVLAELYGPKRLAQAGFDVPRLYRGALVTAYRDLPEEELTAVFASAPQRLRELAKSRYRERGPEDWERRVNAVEGWADFGRRNAIPQLIALSLSGSASVRRRAMKSLGELTKRPSSSLCKSKIGSSVMSQTVSVNLWKNEVRSLDACQEALSAEERDMLSRHLLPALEDADPYVRLQGTVALGLIGSSDSISFLMKMASDSFAAGKKCSSGQGDKSGCETLYPVRDAANKSIDRIRRFVE